MLPGTKGAAGQSVWADLLETYLPLRYQASTAHVADSTGTFSDEIDVVVFDLSVWNVVTARASWSALRNSHPS